MNASKWFTIFLFVVGVLLIVAYSRIVESAGSEIGINTTTARVIQGIYTIGVIFICFSISYLICNWKCDCSKLTGMTGSVYVGFLCLLGIVLTVFGGILVDKTKSLNSSTTKKWAVGIVSVGAITTFMSIAVLVYEHKESIKGAYTAAVGHGGVKVPAVKMSEVAASEPAEEPYVPAAAPAPAPVEHAPAAPVEESKMAFY